MISTEDTYNLLLKKWSITSWCFLDTQIFLDENNIFQFRKFRKPTANDHLLDYNCSITPKKYKISTFKGEIHRCHHTNTTKFKLEVALKNLRKQFLNNNYHKNQLRFILMKLKAVISAHVLTELPKKKK